MLGEVAIDGDALLPECGDGVEDGHDLVGRSRHAQEVVAHRPDDLRVDLLADAGKLDRSHGEDGGILVRSHLAQDFAIAGMPAVGVPGDGHDLLAHADVGVVGKFLDATDQGGCGSGKGDPAQGGEKYAEVLIPKKLLQGRGGNRKAQNGKVLEDVLPNDGILVGKTFEGKLAKVGTERGGPGPGHFPAVDLDDLEGGTEETYGQPRYEGRYLAADLDVDVSQLGKDFLDDGLLVKVVAVGIKLGNGYDGGPSNAWGAVIQCHGEKSRGVEAGIFAEELGGAEANVLLHVTQVPASLLYGLGLGGTNRLGGVRGIGVDGGNGGVCLGSNRNRYAGRKQGWFLEGPSRTDGKQSRH